MSEKIIQYNRTPITPEHTMVVKPDCRVIRLKDPADGDLSRKSGVRDLLLAAQSETISLLEQLELDQGKSLIS